MPSYIHLSRLLRILVLATLVVLTGCGGGPVSGRSSPTSTPVAAAVALAAEPSVEQARAALENGNAALAIELAGPFTTKSAEIAGLLAQARRELAYTSLAAAPGEPAALRAALDQLSQGLALELLAPTLRDELEAERQALLALVATDEARATLEARATAGTDHAELTRLAQALAERAATAVSVQPVLPGAAQVAAAGWLAAANSYETLGERAEQPEIQAKYWREANTLCERAAATVASPAAAECVSRLAHKLAPPAVAQSSLVVQQSPPVAEQSPPTVRPTASPAVRPTAPPAPRARSFAVAQRKSFEGSGTSGQFASCVDVQILGAQGPLAGAVVGINNGEHSYQNQTDGSGYTGRCGLGASTWSVVLFWAPPDTKLTGVATTVYLNGAPEQRAAVVFEER